MKKVYAISVSWRQSKDGVNRLVAKSVSSEAYANLEDAKKYIKDRVKDKDIYENGWCGIYLDEDGGATIYNIHELTVRGE